MRVEIIIRETVQYGRTVEMTEAEFKEWEGKIDSSRGYEAEKIANQIAGKYRLRDDECWIDSDDTEIDVFGPTAEQPAQASDQ